MTMREEIEEAQILERIYHETSEERQDVGLHQPIFNPVRFSHIFSRKLFISLIFSLECRLQGSNITS